MSEHFTKYKNRERLTEVGKHGINAHEEIVRINWKWKILCYEKNELKRKALEAHFIATMKPTLNVSKGLHVIGLDALKIIKEVNAV